MLFEAGRYVNVIRTVIGTPIESATMLRVPPVAVNETLLSFNSAMAENVCEKAGAAPATMDRAKMAGSLFISLLLRGYRGNEENARRSQIQHVKRLAIGAGRQHAEAVRRILGEAGHKVDIQFR